jgi:hypothetical protein
LAYLLRKSKNLRQRRKREKDFRIDEKWKKGGAFFRQGVLRKMYGCEAAEKRGAKKGLLKIEMKIIFITGSCFETPLYTMCWINEDGDKGQVREQGEELGGGGADTRREGLKGHSVLSLAI